MPKNLNELINRLGKQLEFCDGCPVSLHVLALGARLLQQPACQHEQLLWLIHERKQWAEACSFSYCSTSG
jgi:hypothetical protein